MTESIDRERLAKLPKWARLHIARLEGELEAARRDREATMEDLSRASQGGEVVPSRDRRDLKPGVYVQAGMSAPYVRVPGEFLEAVFVSRDGDYVHVSDFNTFAKGRSHAVVNVERVSPDITPRIEVRAHGQLSLDLEASNSVTITANH